MKNIKPSIYICSSLLIVTFVTEIFYKETFYRASLRFAQWAQGPDPENNTLLHASKIISMFGNELGFLLLIVGIYNFSNTYRIFLILSLLQTSVSFIGVLKMVYMHPRPHWVNLKIHPFGCEGGWGNPSGHSLASSLIYLSAWRMFYFENKVYTKKIKLFSLYLVVTFIFLIMFSRVLVGAHTFDQIIFGCSIGLTTYYFIWHVLEINSSDPEQFLRFIKTSRLYNLITNAFVVFIAILLFTLNGTSKYIEEWNSTINLTACKDISWYKRLQNEGLIAVALFFANVGSYYGLRFEYFTLFKENFKNWSHSNFGHMFIDINNYDQATDDRDVESNHFDCRQWNDTTIPITFLRVLAMGVLSGTFGIMLFAIPSSVNIYVFAIFKIAIPTILMCFGLFSIFKLVYKYLGIGHYDYDINRNESNLNLLICRYRKSN